MFTFSRRAMLIFVLAGVLFGCEVEEELLTIGKAIEGDYGVGYYDYVNEKYIHQGILTLKNGEYIFTPQEDVEIPSYMVDRFYFISNPEGEYELTDGGLVNGEDIFEEYEDLDMITMISFQGPEFNESHNSPSSRSFFIRFNAEAKSLFFHSIFNEFQMWGVSKIE